MKNKLGLNIVNTIKKTENDIESPFSLCEKNFNKPEIIIFQADNIIFDVKESKIKTLKDTYKYFTGKQLNDSELIYTQNLGGYSNKFDCTYHLIKQYGFNFSVDDIVNKYEQIYWNDAQGLIDNEYLLIDQNTLKELSSDYKLILYTDNNLEQTQYLLHKYSISNLFSAIFCTENNENNIGKAISNAKETFCTSNICVISPNLDDIKATIKENVFGFAISNNKNTSMILENNGAFLVKETIQEIIKFIEEA